MANKITNVKTEVEVIKAKSEAIMNTIARKAAFYRANPHRLAKDYLNINLKRFQKIIIFMMNKSTVFMYIAARG